jgi:hypothetical protein
MRKAFAKASRRERSRGNPGQKHGRGRPRLHWLALLLLFGPASSLVCGQDVKIRLEPRSAESRARRALREQWFLRGRSSPGQPGATPRYRAHLQKMQMRAARRTRMVESDSLSPTTGAWSPLGPLPLTSDASGVGEYDYGWVSGRATAVAVDPADPSANTVYIGGAYGGVWKSTNAASQSPANVVWQPLTDNQATLAVGAIAIQPGNSSVILVGTGEANSSADSYYGLGILRSADAGVSWTLIPSDNSGSRSFAGMGFSKIAFSGNAPNFAVAATAGTPEGIVEGLENPLTANLGLYYSADSGASWALANVSDGGMAVAPGSATSVVYNAGAGQFFAALRYHGFYSSSDSVNWIRLPNQPGGGLSTSACPANPASSSCPIYRGEFAVVPGRNEMYVWYVDANDFDQGIWSTTNGVTTWTQISDAGIINCGDLAGCGTGQGTYDLELAAVPNGSSGVTDLYAGAVNLYKCEITNASPTCSGTGSNTFLNLTHAYGCSAIAKVHPAQHAVSFLMATGNTQDLMYFANDGGIYRALDGYTGLSTGTCGGSNQFDSLNMTLGSMTQFVSFSQATGDANTILGGTQGNGSPATQSAMASNPVWQNVNFGDGGYSQINPSNEEEWFVSTPPDSTSGVNVFSCSFGINCHTPDFENSQVVNSESVGGDTGAYYPPYILDPWNAGEIILGTCRMWRGPATGGGFAVLSHSFETGGDGVCTGGEINLVRSLAAGVRDINTGFSKVMYAGTDGFGPLVPTTPPGGHVWVSTNVPGGLSTWVDQTGPINPGNFPISGIAMDNSDTQGLTAYVSIMGFHVSHVWRTANGGFSWTDFTANLPDAPVNVVLVDPGTTTSNGTLYVGTDAGVWASSTGSAGWVEVGPAPGSGPGYLPNVAVTALGMFYDTSGNKWLRASTYGRGMWQFPLIVTPDFFLSVSNTPMTLYADNLPARFNGLATAVNGYSSQINLSCAIGATRPPASCSIAPPTLVPSAQGTPFTVTASDQPGDYMFNASGTDSHTVTRNSPITLNIVDFKLTTPSPSSITVEPGTSSGPVRFQVTAQGSFDATVNLSCAGLPTGATCNFQPASASPTANNPVAVILTVETTTNAAAGTYPITIQGSVNGGHTKTQALLLTITLDYSLSISNPLLTSYVNSPVQFDGTLTTLNGYNSPVNLSCGADAPPTCSAAPTPLTPTQSGAAFTVTASSDQCGRFNFNIVAKGTDTQTTSHVSPVTYTATSYTTPNYTLEITPGSLTSPVNSPAIFNGTLQGTDCYNSPVNLSCGSNAPPMCKASPPTLTPTAGGVAFTVTANSNVAQAYSFNIAAVGTDSNTTTHFFLAAFASTFPFSITPNPDAQSLPAGHSATYDVDVSPSASTFPSSVTLNYDNCPPLSTCGFSSTQVTKGSGNTHVAFTISTTAPTSAAMHSSPKRMPPIYALWLSLPGLIVVVRGLGRGRQQRKRFLIFLLLALIVPILWLEIACGGGLQGNSSGNSGNPGQSGTGGKPGTPAGSYPISITATMGPSVQRARVELTVK